MELTFVPEAPEVELEELVGQMHALGCAAHRVLLAAAAELDAREAWRADGARSMADWLCLRLGVTRATALRWVEAARKLGELPALASAYAAGRVGFERMCALAELATPETEQELLETTEAMGTPALQLQARRARGVRLREAARAQAGRYLHLRHEHEQGVVLLRGSLPAEAGALVGRALDRIVESMPRVSGPFDPPEARRADALVALASARVAADADPDRACVVVHVEAGALSGAEEGVAEVEGGALLPGEAVRRLACDGHLEVAVEGEGGRTVGVGRRTRRVPAWLARQIRHRDLGCRFPGCGVLRGAESHHIVHWARGGRTDLDNLALLCRRHHVLVHEGGWALRGDPPGELTFARPDGGELRAGPSPLGPEGRRLLEGAVPT